MGQKLLRQNGISGKHITVLVMIAALTLFVYFPLLMNDVEKGDEPSIFKDADGGIITNEEVYDNITVTFRAFLAFVMAFFGSIGILMA
jgi:hypothetical protein|tara:strand:+ start:49650 stop:49913 length:264 start_codon:yes stop_codon:yes gene_type:complete